MRSFLFQSKFSVYIIFTMIYFTHSHMYYDYILFHVKFLFSLELITPLARELGGVLVCLSFYH